MWELVFCFFFFKDYFHDLHAICDMCVAKPLKS